MRSIRLASLHTDPRLRGDTRGRNGGVRQELAEGIVGLSTMRYADTGWTLSMLRTCSRVIALVAMVACLSMTAQAADESGQYKIRPLDPNNAADQEEIIRWLDPSGTADRDELIRTAIDLDKRFKATNRDIKAAGLWQADYTTPNNVHFTVIADYGVKKVRVHYRFYIRHECEKARAIAQGHGFEAEECSSAPLPPPPPINFK